MRAWYLTDSLNVYDGLAGHGIAGYLSRLDSVFGFKAPMIAALPAPFYLLLSRNWHAAFLVNIVSMLVLPAALRLAHEAVVYDDSNSAPRMVLETRDGIVVWQGDSEPEWVTQTRQALLVAP